MIKDEGIKVVQNNCIRCHDNVNYEVMDNMAVFTKQNTREDKLCWECHREVPHGRVNSLSSAPNTLVPKLKSPVPDWLKKLME